MASKILMCASAGLVALLGLIHLVYTFVGTKLLPRDAGLLEAMNRVPMVITRETTVGRAWTGFNASHSLGLLLFGAVYAYLAIAQPRMLFASWFLLALGFATLAAYVVLAKLYWFSVPLAGVSLALACYIGSVVASRFA